MTNTYYGEHSMRYILAIIAIVAFAGCAKNPLTQEVATPTAAFNYTLQGKDIATNPDGTVTETTVPGDTITVNQEALKDNWSIALDRSYYDTTAMPREGMAAIANVLKAHVDNGTPPTAEQMLLYAGAIETVAQYDIPLILSTEKADVQRANDPEAFAAARVGIAEANARVTEARYDLYRYGIEEGAKTGRSFTPGGLVVGGMDALREYIATQNAPVQAPEIPDAPDVPEVE